VSAYAELTTQIGDQWVAALRRAEDAIARLTPDEGPAPRVDLSEIPLPEPVAKFNEAIRRQFDEAIGKQLPKPSEIVEANYQLAQRLMTAQRDLTLRLLEAAVTAEPPAAT
jgi:hypothetical protein